MKPIAKQIWYNYKNFYVAGIFDNVTYNIRCVLYDNVMTGVENAIDDGLVYIIEDLIEERYDHTEEYIKE